MIEKIRDISVAEDSNAYFYLDFTSIEALIISEQSFKQCIKIYTKSGNVFYAFPEKNTYESAVAELDRLKEKWEESKRVGK